VNDFKLPYAIAGDEAFGLSHIVMRSYVAKNLGKILKFIAIIYGANDENKDFNVHTYLF